MSSQLFKWMYPKQNDQTMYKGRSGHTGLFYKNKLYFFLGETGSKLITNTIIIYDIESENWSIMGTNFGPSCRRSHTTSKKDEMVYLFGGDDGKKTFTQNLKRWFYTFSFLISFSEYLNDMYQLSLEELYWKKITPKNEPPCGRRYHCSVIIDEYLYIFGGEDTIDTMLNDLYKFNLNSFEWTKLNDCGVVPAPRRYSTCISKGKSFYLFAGRDEIVRFNDLWEFNTISENWNCITTYGNIPTLRSAHTAVLCGDSMFIFGGMDGKKINDIQEYDFLTSKWKLIEIDEKPSARYWHVSVISDDDVMYTYGGGDHDMVHEDFYKIKLSRKRMNLQSRLWNSLKNQYMKDVLLITAK
eukprot:gene12069-5562_t